MPDTGTKAMSDSEALVRQDDNPARPGRRRSWLPAAFAAIALALIAAGAGWWFLNNRQAIPEWDRLPALDLAAPAGDAFRADTPWVNLRLTTGRPGEENGLRVQITPRTRQGDTGLHVRSAGTDRFAHRATAFRRAGRA